MVGVVVLDFAGGKMEYIIKWGLRKLFPFTPESKTVPESAQKGDMMSKVSFFMKILSKKEYVLIGGFTSSIRSEIECTPLACLLTCFKQSHEATLYLCLIFPKKQTKSKLFLCQFLHSILRQGTTCCPWLSCRMERREARTSLQAFLAVCAWEGT